MNVSGSIMILILINHNSTGVTSGVTLIKKIELKVELNADKMDCRTPK